MGDVFMINLIFNSGARIILEEEYSETNLSTMKRNLNRNWCWDKDGFFMNQFGHPYQGSLYFASGRSNGLDFWQSFFVAATGSLLWEEFGETTTPAVNDFITTPICGTLIGEGLHRLYIDASELCPPLAWILSPISALNSSIRNTKYSVSGRTEEIDFFFHGESLTSKVDFSDNQTEDLYKKNAGGGGIHIQYGNPEAHSTKEPLDLFTVDMNYSISPHYYSGDFCIDGFLYSRALYFEESEGTLGINLLYDGKKTKDTIFSNSALGIKYFGSKKFSSSDVKVQYFFQLDGVFLGTRGLYRLTKDINVGLKKSIRENPPRTYNFGGGVLLKMGFSLGNRLSGTFYGNAEISFLGPYPYARLDDAECNGHFLFFATLAYEHEVTKHFSAGVKDYFICKKDWFVSEADCRQIVNSLQLYGKFTFRR
ncbi:MAG: DUF3943 domain-containing protein [Treponema sp.]|nr:DUF3943 domain-containing protein [Treponema sp.]